MSTRERWIVYPLLFMTLGIALRDKVIPPDRLGNFNMTFEAGTVVTPRIRCQELVCDQLHANQSRCNTLLVIGPNGKPVIAAGTDNKTKAGILETYTIDGMSQVRLLSSSTGGIVSTVERSGKLLLTLGDTGEAFGVFAELPGLGQVFPLTLPWRFEKKPTMPQPKETPSVISPEQGMPSESENEPEATP